MTNLKDKPLYPSRNAFVLQFGQEADLSSGQCKGKVEQVLTGEAVHFNSLDELMGFLARHISNMTDKC